MEAQMVGISGLEARMRPRAVPLLHNVKVRMVVGLLALVVSVMLAAGITGEGPVEVMLAVNALAWLPAVLLTDKYVHKYPQRYVTYLIASHLKSAILMSCFLWVLAGFVVPATAPPHSLWMGMMIFAFADAILSIPRKREMLVPNVHVLVEEIVNEGSCGPPPTSWATPPFDREAIVREISRNVDDPMVEFAEKALPDYDGGTGAMLVLDDMPTVATNQPEAAPVAVIVGRIRLNDVFRLNQFLQFCASRLSMHGYLLVRYTPIDQFLMNMRLHHNGFLYWMIFLLHYLWYRAIPKIPWLDTVYFKLPWLDAINLSITKRRNRALTKAEVWGRLAYSGMTVIRESHRNGEAYLLARRDGYPFKHKKPSYYPLVALEKVGLEGRTIHCHKFRTMYPFSEFIQKRIYEEHGLAPTGKFSNDFRLTGLGQFLRKYWLDELPQVYDWLRGDIKLVGIRATSRHFLSLYPKNFLRLYLQIKPGLIPPIFDESVRAFDQIVGVELAYLRRYWDRPFRTDILYLLKTLGDIVLRGVRSK